MNGTRHHRFSRRTSEFEVLRSIVSHPNISRSDICHLTGLSRPTVIEVLDVLLSTGLVNARVMKTGGQGRAPELFSLNERHLVGAVVCLDAATIKVAIVDLNGALIDEVTVATDSRGGADIVRQVQQIVGSRLSRLTTPIAHPSIVILSAPGMPDVDGSIRGAPAAMHLGAFDVVSSLETALSCHVVAENRVNLSALGELAHMTNPSSETFAVVWLDDGISMAIVSDGHLVRGSRGRAGDVGFLPLDSDLSSPLSRRYGASEVKVCIPAIEAQFANAGSNKSVDEILNDAAQGRQPAAVIVDESARILARVMLSVAAVLDPTQIILHGRLGTNPHLVASLRRHVDEIAPFLIRVLPSELGVSAETVGGGSVARRVLMEQVLRLPTYDASEDDDVTTWTTHRVPVSSTRKVNPEVTHAQPA